MKRFMYIALLVAAVFSAGARAELLSERLAAVVNASGVLDAQITQQPLVISGFPALSAAEITYYVVSGDIVQVNTVGLIVFDAGGPSESAYWSRKSPDILKPAEPAPTYITDRNTPFTAAQIQTFCNNLWKSANPSATDILEFSVSAVSGKAVKVSGRFDVGSASREYREYYIWLVDPNGSVVVGNANVKFERIAAASP